MKKTLKIDVVLLPTLLRPGQPAGRTVVVFDVLRATTTITAALVAGVSEVRVLPAPEAAAEAVREFTGPKLLCGERECLPPPGFDLGNSPGQFDSKFHSGRTVFFATTNGTKALLAASEAERVFVGALVNAAAVAGRVRAAGLDVILLCAGTDGDVSTEDLIGCGAVIVELGKLGVRIEFGNDSAGLAVAQFELHREGEVVDLSQTTGAKNIRRAGLESDVAFASRLNVFDIVGEFDPKRATITRS